MALALSHNSFLLTLSHPGAVPMQPARIPPDSGTGGTILLDCQRGHSPRTGLFGGWMSPLTALQPSKGRGAVEQGRTGSAHDIFGHKMVLCFVPLVILQEEQLYINN